jgi:hypothetical protein
MVFLLNSAIFRVRQSKGTLISFFLLVASTPVLGQVAFQPPHCDFQTVFVVAPDIKEAVMPDGQGKLQKSVTANLGVVLEGKPNFFRAECTEANVPAQLDEKLLLDDMNTIAKANGLRKPHTWVEKDNSRLIGRVRGEFTDSAATYVIDIHRFFGKHSVFDVWIGSPPDTFPSKGNLIFLKEIKVNGKRMY